MAAVDEARREQVTFIRWTIGYKDSLRSPAMQSDRCPTCDSDCNARRGCFDSRVAIAQKEAKESKQPTDASGRRDGE